MRARGLTLLLMISCDHQSLAYISQNWSDASTLYVVSNSLPIVRHARSLKTQRINSHLKLTTLTFIISKQIRSVHQKHEHEVNEPVLLARLYTYLLFSYSSFRALWMAMLVGEFTTLVLKYLKNN